MNPADLKDDDIVYYLAASLDGYIAGAKGEVDWLAPYFVPELGFHDFIGRVQTLIMGRATYEKIAEFGQWPYGSKKGVVVSHRPLSDFAAPVTRVEGSCAEIMQAARAVGPGPYWIIGGADLATQFITQGGLTRIDLFVIPELLGRGVPGFMLQHQTKLELVSTQAYANSVARLSYRPRRA